MTWTDDGPIIRFVIDNSFTPFKSIPAVSNSYIVKFSSVTLLALFECIPDCDDNPSIPSWIYIFDTLLLIPKLVGPWPVENGAFPISMIVNSLCLYVR